MKIGESQVRVLPDGDKIQLALAIITGISLIISLISLHFSKVASVDAKRSLRTQALAQLYASATQVEKNVFDYPALRALGWLPANKVTDDAGAKAYFRGALKALTGKDCPSIADLGQLEACLSDNSIEEHKEIRECLQRAHAHVCLILDNTEAAFRFWKQKIITDLEWQVWLHACDLISPHPLYLNALNTDAFNVDFRAFLENRLAEKMDEKETVDTVSVAKVYLPNMLKPVSPASAKR